ncbi:hypothetical protein PY310_19630 [Pseudarthrobacter sp. H3Y2-7]|uniref:hypothetical protein n=1 Tax=Pseudarthrobacter naphthalenicus TaxID=3031328 RepID=UPI0023B05CB0|nr:hypothetical protein [Pseudarthrobacter sp. H3Y2-7]MDE8670787.1 hypothetical protein [Pseudarthrobacter sp. H3Y2-7]
MASHTKNPVGETLTWTATIGGVAALIGMFFPLTQEFLTATGLWGWVAFATLLGLLPWLVRFWASSQLRAKQLGLRREWEAEQWALQRDSKDLLLVREWLGGWDLHGVFHVYLVEHIHFGHLPLWFVQQMDERRSMWDRDPRKLENPTLREEWERFRIALDDFADRINENMWLESRSRAEREAGDKAFMHIPPEWKTRDHVRYHTAVDELSKCRQVLAASMSSLLGTLYSYSPDAGSKG